MLNNVIKYTPRFRQNGFTIVELLIVVVVIGILAAVVLVAYNGVQRNAVASVMKESVQSAGTKMKFANADTESYPTTLPSDLKAPAGIGFALATVATSKEFCINVTSQRYADLSWHTDQTGTLQSGLCSGAVITASIVGDYGTASSTPVTSVVTVQGSPVTTNGTATNFKIKTDEAWTNITLSWNAIPSATQYEIQTRDSAGSWAARRVGDGYGSYAGGGGTSGVISASTTSLVWTYTDSRPTTAGQTHEYRYRAYVSGVAGDWSTASLTVPTTDSMGTVKNLNVVPNTAWSNATISWAAPEGFGSPSSVIYELQTRVGSGSWAARRASDGYGSYAGGGGTSGETSLSTTSYVWTEAQIIPQAPNASVEFRIRVRSSSTPSIYGPWSTFTLSAPSNATLAGMSSFTVVPNGSWSNITLSWTAPAGLGSPSEIDYEIYTRTAGGTWYARALSNGSGQYAGGGGTSGSIALSTTSPLTWSGSIPAAGQSHEYRMRVKSTASTAVYGPWTTVTLTRP